MRNDTHDAAQHLNTSFQDFHDRRFFDIHGGSLSQTVGAGGGAAAGFGGTDVVLAFGFSALWEDMPGERTRSAARRELEDGRRKSQLLIVVAAVLIIFASV